MSGRLRGHAWKGGVAAVAGGASFVAVGAASPSSGVDPSATNEITGALVSDGDHGTGGILGARIPALSEDGRRAFHTQPHGDNVTCEVIPSLPSATRGSAGR